METCFIKIALCFPMPFYIRYASLSEINFCKSSVSHKLPQIAYPFNNKRDADDQTSVDLFLYILTRLTVYQNISFHLKDAYII